MIDIFEGSKPEDLETTEGRRVIAFVKRSDGCYNVAVESTSYYGGLPFAISRVQPSGGLHEYNIEHIRKRLIRYTLPFSELLSKGCMIHWGLGVSSRREFVEVEYGAHLYSLPGFDLAGVPAPSDFPEEWTVKRAP